MNGTILVTGSSGLLGRAVCERLAAAGHAVLGLDPSVDDGRQPWRTVRDDLSDERRLADLLVAERVAGIVHAGGVSGPMVLADAPVEVIRTNVAGTLHLLFAALGTGVSRFLYCSSISAVGDFFADEPQPDDLPLRPTSAYGCSKAAVDFVLTGLWRRVPMDLVSLRYTGIYGPGRRTAFVVDDLVEAALAGREAILQPQSPWPYVYVDDAADATVAALLSDRRRQLFYSIAHPEMVSVADIAAAVEAHAGPVLWREDASRPPVRRGPLSIEAAARDFGFAPTVGIAEGVRRTVDARRARP